MRPLTPKASFLRLQRFCLELGWEAPLVMHRAPTKLDDLQRPSLTRYFYTMYEVDSPIYVQINPQTELHPRLFAMSICAMRYRLCTGWHGFMLDRHMASELRKVRSWLHSSIVCTEAGRRLLRKNHPECSAFNWKRIRDCGPPYTQNSTYERWLAR
jgi:hypothetical protein